MSSYEEQLAKSISDTGLLDKANAISLLTTPQDSSHGDFCLPCFSLAKSLRKAPAIIAQELAKTIILPPTFCSCEAVAGYLNFRLDPIGILRQILESIHKQGTRYGHREARKETVVIDFSSPNIGKELAFHHLRSTMIGNALSRIYSADGFHVVRINHLGDWGTQFGKLITSYLLENLPTDDQSLAQLEIKDLNRLYTAFSKIAKEDPSLEDKARAAFASLEKGDPFHRKLWEAFRASTMRELMRIYEMMGVEFDFYTGESFFETHMEPVVKELETRGLLVHSQERDVVMLEEEGLPPCLVRKSDGSTLYATRDLAAAIYRKQQYNFARCLYVVDNGQSLHFRQVFATLSRMGYDWAKNCAHIPFGLILHLNEAGKWEKGKTRTGSSSLLRDVIEAAQDKILAYIEQKNPGLENKELIATQIGVSALTFNDLKNRRQMDVKFDWDAALSFEGATGPYVQNAHVRLCSILAKVSGKVQVPSNERWSVLAQEHSINLVRVLGRKADRISQAREIDEPYILAQYALEIAEAAHRFIHHYRVLGSPEQEERLFLVHCTQQVLEDVLQLLGVFPIRAM